MIFPTHAMTCATVTSESDVPGVGLFCKQRMSAPRCFNFESKSLVINTFHRKFRIFYMVGWCKCHLILKETLLIVFRSLFWTLEDVMAFISK